MKEKKDALARVETSLERPDWLKAGDTRGSEHLQKADVRIPRICIAQGLSPQIKEEEASYIPDLKSGQLFNDLTEQIYGKGPLYFAIVRADKPRGMELRPRKEGGGIIDPNVPLDDPRMQWEGDQLPRATKFYDYIIILFHGADKAGEMVALSFKSTGISTAKQLNGLIQIRNAPLFSGMYSVGVASRTNQKGTFYVYSVKNAGFIGDRAVYEHLEKVFDDIKDTEFEIAREAPGEGEGDSTAETPKENVPF